MADHAHNTAPASHPDMDYNEHERTYGGFLVLVEWGLIVNILILVGMAIVLL